MRKQYYFHRSERGLLSWDVDRLVRLTRDFPRKQYLLSDIRELDEEWFDHGERPTWRAMAKHIELIDQTDLSYPIILSQGGAVMDGMHRSVKALLQGRDQILAVQFDQDPEPDNVGLGPDELPY